MIIENFISNIERSEILSFIETIDHKPKITNKHISEVAKSLNGNVYMFDITKTKISNYLSDFQSSNNICDVKLPDIIHKLKDRISSQLNINDSNVFLQIINSDMGGSVKPHYDTSYDGYINYKCNICLKGDDYLSYIGDDTFTISEGDLYCFEASLYKHWTSKFNSKRIVLSFGFALTYEEMGRSESDPRVRLSKRINKYFQ